MEVTNFSLKTKARFTGIFYFLTAATTIFGLLYVRGELINYRDANETGTKILSYEFLFRLGIGVNLFCQVLHLFLAFSLFELFKNVNSFIAKIMLSSKLISLTLAVTGILGSFAALNLLTKSQYFAGFNSEQINSLTLLFLRLTNEMQGLLEVFWLPTNFCIGLLIIKSKFIPKIFGYLMILGSFGFVINVYLKLLAPDWQLGTVTTITMIFGALGGLPFMFYLMIIGAKAKHLTE